MGRLAPGARLGAGLVLVDRIGKGGLGEVWLARDDVRGTVVAKVLSSGASPELGALLDREARVAAALQHPAIVRVHGSGHDGERAWLVMEHVAGGDARRLRGASSDEVARALLPLVDALEHAHAKGVVHRDIKASNVLLDAGGRALLSDFGLAALLSPGAPGEPVGGGSKGSMSPQQLDGEAPNPADDVYGLGALLYDLLAGQPPFWPDFDPRRTREEAPAPLGARVPLPLRELVARMLAKRREERPGLDEVRSALSLALPPEQPPIPAGPRRVPDVPPPAPPLPSGAATRARPGVAFVPPPRADALVAPAPLPKAAVRAAGRASRSNPAFVAGLFGTLSAATAVVFLVLPRWVADRPSGSAAPPAAAPAPRSDAPAASAGASTATTGPPAAGSSSATPEAGAEGPARGSAEEPERARAARVDGATAGRAAAAQAVPDVAAAAWSEAVSEGLSALDRGDLALAKAAFARAEVARPATRAVADGMARVEEGLRAQALASHREKAAAAEGREDWRGAATEYDAALRIDPQLAFAVAGRERALARARLDEQLRGYLERPDRLSAEAVAREAEAALEQARETPRPGPRLAQQVTVLENRLVEARTPVAVPLQSDGLTEVSVLRVGPLGTFREKTVPLRPGSYVVVGKRAGYRDARRTLVVAPGGSPAPLLVRCEEAL